MDLDKIKRRLSDKSRKAVRVGKTFIVPHKFKKTGEVITKETFDPKSDISKLNTQHWLLLEAMQKNGWSVEKTAESIGMDLEDAKRLAKRIKHFEFEEQKGRALTAILSPNFVTSKHIENVYTNSLEDGQRDSLKELAKITGAYKTTASLQITQNVFNLPTLAPEIESEFKALAEKALDAEVMEEPRAANA